MYKYTNKIDALTGILKRLDAGEKLTAELLSHDLQVGVRTIFRYLNHLQAAGYPIYYDKEERSYRFLNNFRLNHSKVAGSSELFALHPLNQVSSLAVATFRTSGECVQMNMAMQQLLGCFDPLSSGGNFRAGDWWRESGLQALADEAIETGREVCRDMTLSCQGRERWIQAHLTPVQQDTGSYLVFLAQDLSPRMYKEIQVARFFAAMNQSSNLILVTDTDGTIEYVNERVEELTGYTAEELIGVNPRILKSGQTPPEVYQNLWSTISSGYTWSGELYNRRKNGDYYWQHIQISPIRNHLQDIRRYVAVIEDISRQKLLDEEIYRYAVCDRITGLYNRTMLLELGNRDIAAAQRYGRAMTLLIIDIDRFKQVNDQYGYPVGNQILQRLADLCRDTVRSSDLLGRVGKDSFAILLSETSLEAAEPVAERIRRNAAEICTDQQDGRLLCTVSVGGVALEQQHREMVQLVDACERLLLQHQARQSNSCVGFR